MRILMLTPYLPFPPSSGGQVRSYNLLKNLGQRHKIVLVALIKNNEEKKYVKHLEKFCQKIIVCKRSENPWTLSNITRSLFGLYPFLVVRNFSKKAQQTVHDLLRHEKIDLIHAETFYIMPHIPKTTIPILLVEQTIEYKVYQHFVKSLKYVFLKPLFFYDVLKLRFWEKAFWRRATVVGVMSEDDKQKILQVMPGLEVEIIPNAAGEDLTAVYKSEKQIKKPIFLYQGNFFWLQNIEAATILAELIFPRIKKKIPSANCYIAGQKATEKIGHLTRLGIKIIDIESSDIETVKAVYDKASVFLAPIAGPGGTRLKILGAMAAGVPVISSPTGVSGLEVENGTHVLIAKNETEFVKLSVSILKNKKRYQEIRENAKNLVEEKYNWTVVSAKLEKIYQQLRQFK